MSPAFRFMDSTVYLITRILNSLWNLLHDHWIFGLSSSMYDIMAITKLCFM